jgi:predicted aldo/keto reductase-like oxidoreductase
MKKSISRRSFVKSSVLGIGTVGLISGGSLIGKDDTTREKKEDVNKLYRIQKYRKLGKTGFDVSDVSLGFVKNVGVLKAALDAGVNYIDTAESYGNQPQVGEGIKGRDRKKLFITSKMEITEKQGFDKKSFLKRFAVCLKELDTDYIDCMMMHSVGTTEILKTRGFHEAMDQMKKEGKLRFVGVSNHGSMHPEVTRESMEKILTAAALDGRFDVFLLTYNFLQEENGAKVLELCEKKGIGATIMKKNPVASYYGIKSYLDRMKKAGKEPNKLYAASIDRFKKKADQAGSFIKQYNLQDESAIRDAAIRFVLSNDKVNSVICGVSNFDQLATYLKLSGSSLSIYDKKQLAAYKEGCSQLYCRHACGECQHKCPSGVPVNTIMRFHHYYDAEGRQKYAMKRYAKLEGSKADLCMNCEGFCEQECGYGVPVQGMLIRAHERLSLV